MTCMYKHEIKSKRIGQGGDKNLLGGGGGDFFQVGGGGMSKFSAGGETSPTPPPVGKTLVSAATNFHIFQTIISRLLQTNFQTKQSFYLSTSFLKYPCHY